MRALRRVTLAIEIALAYAQARWLLSRRDLPGTLAVLRRRTTRTPGQRGDGVIAGVHLGWAVHRLLRALPADSRCLTQSLVLSRLLDRRGISSSLVIGVRSGEAFGAHAWVEVTGRPVLEPGEDAYLRLVEL